MGRIRNFSAGPGVLPEAVLARAAQEMMDYHGSGMSVTEMSHRSKVYEGIHYGAIQKLRDLLSISDDYAVLFLQGGASMQFAMVAQNLMPVGGQADYIDSGNFASAAIEQGKKFGQVNVVASSKQDKYTYIPATTRDTFTPGAAYVHTTGNNTIYGTRFIDWPDTGDIPLVCDLSSSILSEPLDVSRFGLIYAGAQKNMGPAGVTCVIIRKDLLGRARPETPAMLDYAVHAKADSLYNTPPTFSIYMLGLVLEWIEGLGGLTAMQKLNQDKAALLYDYIDASAAFSNPVQKPFRSIMNVPFVLATPELDDAFIKAAAAEGFANLKGHRAVGGMRASIYNAMPRQAIEDLVAFMRNFEAKL